MLAPMQMGREYLGQDFNRSRLYSFTTRRVRSDSSDSRVHRSSGGSCPVKPRQIERAFPALVVLLGLTAMPARAAEPVSVLVLEQEDPDRPAYGMFMSGFRQELASRISERVNVYSENLDLARFDTPAYRNHGAEAPGTGIQAPFSGTGPCFPRRGHG